MNEKRFIYEEKLDVIHYWEEGNRFQLDVRNLKDVTVTLNTLQARIELLEDNLLADNLTMKHLNGIIDEQQATICKLQDLCGESDGENAKLRIKNKKLKEENEQLRKENAQLTERLRECRMRLDRFNCR